MCVQTNKNECQIIHILVWSSIDGQIEHKHVAQFTEDHKKEVGV